MSKKGKCLWCGGELPKHRRKYCCDEHANLYFIHYISPLWWNNARRMALERAGYKCENCGSAERLEVHHKEALECFESRHNSPKNRQDNLKVLCRPCHEKEHHPNAGKKAVKQPPKEQIAMELKL
jgi:5-methylcytosine-specific restriction endonuclease McrA